MQKITASIDYLKENYDLSSHSAINIIECVKAFDKYDKLPLATKESLQSICDVYNIMFTFGLVKKKLVLTGISTIFISTYLYTEETLKMNSKLKSIRNINGKCNKIDGYLLPKGNHVITWEKQ